MALDSYFYRINRKVNSIEDLERLELKATEKPEQLDFTIKEIYEKEGSKGVLDKIFKDSLTTSRDMLFLDFRIQLAIDNVHEFYDNRYIIGLKDENLYDANYEPIIKQTMGYWSRHGDLQRYMTSLYQIKGFTGDINCKNIILDKNDLITLITVAKLAIKGEYKSTVVGFNWENTSNQDWERTIEMLQDILDTTDFENETIYYYSWW